MHHGATLNPPIEKKKKKKKGKKARGTLSPLAQ
jgi:hypothetical protein